MVIPGSQYSNFLLLIFFCNMLLGKRVQINVVVEKNVFTKKKNTIEQGTDKAVDKTSKTRSNRIPFERRREWVCRIQREGTLKQECRVFKLSLFRPTHCLY